MPEAKEEPYVQEQNMGLGLSFGKPVEIMPLDVPTSFEQNFGKPKSGDYNFGNLGTAKPFSAQYGAAIDYTSLPPSADAYERPGIKTTERPARDIGGQTITHGGFTGNFGGSNIYIKPAVVKVKQGTITAGKLNYNVSGGKYQVEGMNIKVNDGKVNISQPNI